MPSLAAASPEVVFSQAAVGVMKMKIDGTQRKRIEQGGWGVQWSPDGQTIAFTATTPPALTEWPLKRDD